MPPRWEREAPATGPVVQGFAADGGFRVEGATHAALLLTPERAIGWDASALDRLSEADLVPLLDLIPAPEFLLLGTGPTLLRPPPLLAAALDRRGIGIEPMDSRTAARSWNLLRGEGRWIIGALLPF